jgi:spore maturation protein CgeB
MIVVLFCHSLLSDWNHGNAHFLRGVVTELAARGAGVRVFEPRGAWSFQNLEAEPGGAAAVQEVLAVYPAVRPIRYEPSTFDLDAALEGADLVLVHEWNDHALVKAIGERRARGGRFKLLFHDTHHRGVTDARAMAGYELSHYDGVVAFGNVLRDLYLRRGWAQRAWTWHEAADTRVFAPGGGPAVAALRDKLQGARKADLVWIGNWGDEERTAELREFLLEPVRALGLRAIAYGVRFPDEGRAALAQAGIEYRGWLPNHRVPMAFAQSKVTLHIPRRPYARALPGIPTIRPFEAMACGIPFVSAPWSDTERLFTPGKDFLMAKDGAEMTRLLRELIGDAVLRRTLAWHGEATLRARHTCRHRTDELLSICGEIGVANGAPPSTAMRRHG